MMMTKREASRSAHRFSAGLAFWAFCTRRRICESWVSLPVSADLHFTGNRPERTAGEQRLAGALGLQRGFAGQQRFVDFNRLGNQYAIRGYRFAGRQEQRCRRPRHG